jgi:hypothetical protein
MVGYESLMSGNAEPRSRKNVTDSSLDSLQIDVNRCQALQKKLFG